MLKATRLTITLAVAVALLPAGALWAQARQPQHIFLPNVSQRAEVAQTIGMTEIRVSYHRPAVNDRTIWGGLVPYGQVWRTGANENTLISFSTDVRIEGQDLAAGTYGLHTLPAEDQWQVIFSRDNTAWGSFSYDEANDALRVAVEPEETEHMERLVFTVDEPAADSAVVAMRWEKLRLPIRVEIDGTATTLASIREQLKGLSQFFWQGWNQAANYCATNDVSLEEGLEWADRSIGIQKGFNNLSTKAQILSKLNRGEEAMAVMEEALPLGNAGNLHNYARTLIGLGMTDEAVRIFQVNVERHPEAWFVELGLARGYSAQGEFVKAAEAMKLSLAKAPENQKVYVQGLVDQLEKGEDIN